VVLEHFRRGFAGPVEQARVGGQVGEAQERVARLARAEEFARPADLQVAPGDLEAVAGFLHGAQALLGGVADAPAVVGGVEQHAGRRRCTAPDAPAQLVQLREAEALGVLDHHERGVRHVHPHLDDGGADQHAQMPGREQRHHRLLFRRRHARVQQPHGHARQGFAQLGVHGGGVGKVERLALLDQRADPVHLAPGRHLRGDARDDLVLAAVGDQLGDHRRAAGGQFVDHRDVQVGVVAHGQGARDGRGAHHQHVRLAGGRCATGRCRQLLPQRQALQYAEAVLLVDDGERQALELHLLLDHGVRADHQRRRAAGHLRERRRPLLLLLPADQPGDALALGGEQGFEPAHELGEMLRGEDFGRRHQGALPAGVDGARGGQRRDHRLARPDIALQQPVHGLGARQVGADLAHHAPLRGGECERQRGLQALPQGVGALRRRQHRGMQARALAPRLVLRELLRQQLLGLEPLPRGVAVVHQRGECHIGRRSMQKSERFTQTG